ncbi:aminotransferase class IV [Sphingomonas sp. LB2R24]|uniref:aminotransferase class IV n=1 Tax=Sphingomonas sorbitolis TaxID=3096165 RepID=UPI002FC67B5F
MTLASEFAWVNGTLLPREQGAPSLASISFHLGTGVFDGIMAYWNGDHYYLHEIDAHLDRFKAGAARMSLPVHWSKAELLAGIEELLERGPKETQYIRPIAYRGAPELWITGNTSQPPDVSIFTVRLGKRRELGSLLSCHLSPIERTSSKSTAAQTKVCGSYVNSFLARSAAEALGFDDGIMLDRNGLIAEASAANIFLISKNSIITPRLSPEIFPGITRIVILNLCRKLGTEAVEIDITPHDLRGVSGAFLCSTLMEMRGVSRIGNQLLDTSQSEIYQELISAFSKHTSQ